MTRTMKISAKTIEFEKKLDLENVMEAESRERLGDRLSSLLVHGRVASR